MGMGTKLILYLFIVSFMLRLTPIELGGSDAMYNSTMDNFGGTTSETKGILETNILNVVFGDSLSSAGAIVAASVLASSQGLMYIVPAAMVTRVSIFILEPIADLVGLALPSFVGEFITGLFSVVFFLIFMSYVRGSDL